MSLRRPHDRRPRRTLRPTRGWTAALAAGLLVAGGFSALALTPGQAEAAQGKAPVADDFDGDGYADLVTGAPGATISGQKQAGYVAVTYGSAKGLQPGGARLLSRSTAGVPGSATAKERFGTSFDRGDLDGDGYGDLVIGTADGSTGSVVLWGSPDGLTGGTSLAKYGQTPRVGDFDGDGKADLALFGDPGTWGDDPPTQQAALWRGPVSRTGKPAGTLDFMDRSEWWGYGNDGPACAEDDSCVDGPHSVSGPTTGEAVGDVNGDGRDDIAVRRYAGDGVWSYRVLLGGATGFKESQDVGDTHGINGDAALGLGDVDGDGFDDVVVGAGWDAQQVTVNFGSQDGPSSERVQSFDQSLPGFYGAQEDEDRVGSCVSVEDVTGDGRAEVALGISGEDFSDLKDAGAVALVHGSAAGVVGEGSTVVNQNSPGVPGVAESMDTFGASCALLDVDGDGHRDLTVSSAKENASAGAVWSLRGSAAGLTTSGAKAFGPGDVGGPVTVAEFGELVR